MVESLRFIATRSNGETYLVDAPTSRVVIKGLDDDFWVFPVAGYYYHLPSVPVDHYSIQVRLVEDFNNPFDSNAIVIETVYGAKIGYVPRAINKEIREFLTDRKFYCNLFINPQGQLHIDLKFMD